MTPTQTVLAKIDELGATAPEYFNRSSSTLKSWKKTGPPLEAFEIYLEKEGLAPDIEPLEELPDDLPEPAIVEVTAPEQPPISNEYVEPGAEQFSVGQRWLNTKDNRVYEFNGKEFKALPGQEPESPMSYEFESAIHNHEDRIDKLEKWAAKMGVPSQPPPNLARPAGPKVVKSLNRDLLAPRQPQPVDPPEIRRAKPGTKNWWQPYNKK